MRLSLIATLFVLLSLPGWTAPNMEGGLIFHDMLIHQATSSAGRTALHTDPIEYEIIHGRWTLPVDGVDGWEGAAPRKDWGYEHEWLAGGWASWQIESPREQVMILEAQGHSLVYVNGEIHMGDPYSTGYVMLPVLMREGMNEFLFLCGRGSVYPKLTVPPAPIFINDRDITMPDYDSVGGFEQYYFGVPVVNASTETITLDDHLGLFLLGDADDSPYHAEAVQLPPLSVRKMPLMVHDSSKESSNIPTRVTLAHYPAEIASREWMLQSAHRFITDIIFEVPLTLEVRMPGKAYKDSYISKVDGSAQYYAVVPKDPASTSEENALILSLHGASVEAIGQAKAYGVQDWATIVCPTNRRPYGFDWEDWGRLDAMDVLAAAQPTIGRMSPLYLTGHSMGGHGTWHLAATASTSIDPAQSTWRAIGPSAGWESFFTYAAKPRPTFDDPLREAIERASNQSDTSLLLNNLLRYPTYILHGDADDNVPVTEARVMFEQLTALGHPALKLHEEPGQGHWWDLDQERPGADCVDWAPMWDFMRRQPERDPLVTDITVINPALGPSGPVTIQQQVMPMMLSRVEGRWNADRTQWTGTTENVASLMIYGKQLGLLTLKIDGIELRTDRPDVGVIDRDADGHWRFRDTNPPLVKSTRHTGPFKQAFNRSFVLVYGTAGTPAEDEAILARARYDAEQWWVRGNGQATVLSDVEFLAGRYINNSVILYGNADTNAMWDALLADCPIQVKNGEATVGLHTTISDGIGGLFCFPRQGTHSSMVGVVTGTDIVGLRLTERMRYFTAGVHYPDYMFLSTDNLLAESEGIVDAGYFSNTWEIE